MSAVELAPTRFHLLEPPSVTAAAAAGGVGLTTKPTGEERAILSLMGKYQDSDKVEWCNEYTQNCVKFPTRKKSGKTFSRAKMGESSAAAYLAAHTWQPGQHFNCLKTQHWICRCFNILPTAPNIANITQYNITKYFPTKIFGRFSKYFEYRVWLL